MRTLLFASLLVLAFGCGTKNPSAQLNGTWVPIKQEMSGVSFADSIFAKEELVMSDSNYTLTAESVDKGVVRYNGDNKMDIYGRDGVNAGKHFTAIYKMENNELTICYNLGGDAYPQSFDTQNKPTYFLSVFKKKINMAKQNNKAETTSVEIKNRKRVFIFFILAFKENMF